MFIGAEIFHIFQFLPLGGEEILDQAFGENACDLGAFGKGFNRAAPCGGQTGEVFVIGIARDGRGRFLAIFDAVQRRAKDGCDQQIRVGIAACDAMLDPSGGVCA